MESTKKIEGNSENMVAILCVDSCCGKWYEAAEFQVMRKDAIIIVDYYPGLS
jgi:hypothetical protein